MDWFTLSIVDQIINKAESVDKSSDIKNHNLKGKKKNNTKKPINKSEKKYKNWKKKLLLSVQLSQCLAKM